MARKQPHEDNGGPDKQDDGLTPTERLQREIDVAQAMGAAEEKDSKLTPKEIAETQPESSDPMLKRLLEDLRNLAAEEEARADRAAEDGVDLVEKADGNEKKIEDAKEAGEKLVEGVSEEAEAARLALEKHGIPEIEAITDPDVALKRNDPKIELLIKELCDLDSQFAGREKVARALILKTPYGKVAERLEGLRAAKMAREERVSRAKPKPESRKRLDPATNLESENLDPIMRAVRAASSHVIQFGESSETALEKAIKEKKERKERKREKEDARRARRLSPPEDKKETAEELQGLELSAASTTLASELHPERNEDALFREEGKGLFGVFDGMGGHANGERASHIARDYVLESLKKLSQNAPPEEIAQAIFTTLHEANTKILEEAKRDPRLKGMGTTASILKIWESADRKERKAIIGHIGDSRIYLQHAAGWLWQTSIDDSWVQTIVEDPTEQKRISAMLDNLDSKEALEKLTPLERACFNQRAKITQNLGYELAKPQIEVINLNYGDRFILTSDGIHDNLTRNEIARALEGAKSSEEAVVFLSRSAEERSRDTSHIRAKADDMSVVVIDVGSRQRTAAPEGVKEEGIPAIENSGWREVKEDEILPPGLEIRMDMATGRNFVKKAPETRGDVDVKNEATDMATEGKVTREDLERQAEEIYGRSYGVKRALGSSHEEARTWALKQKDDFLRYSPEASKFRADFPDADDGRGTEDANVKAEPLKKTEEEAPQEAREQEAEKIYREIFDREIRYDDSNPSRAHKLAEKAKQDFLDSPRIDAEKAAEKGLFVKEVQRRVREEGSSVDWKEVRAQKERLDLAREEFAKAKGTWLRGATSKAQRTMNEGNKGNEAIKKYAEETQRKMNEALEKYAKERALYVANNIHRSIAEQRRLMDARWREKFIASPDAGIIEKIIKKKRRASAKINSLKTFFDVKENWRLSRAANKGFGRESLSQLKNRFYQVEAKVLFSGKRPASMREYNVLRRAYVNKLGKMQQEGGASDREREELRQARVFARPPEVFDDRGEARRKSKRNRRIQGVIIGSLLGLGFTTGIIQQGAQRGIQWRRGSNESQAKSSGPETALPPGIKIGMESIEALKPKVSITPQELPEAGTLEMVAMPGDSVRTETETADQAEKVMVPITTDFEYHKFYYDNISYAPNGLYPKVENMMVADFLSVFTEEKLLDGRIANEAGADFNKFLKMYYQGNEQRAFEGLVRFASVIQGFHPDSNEEKMTLRYYLTQNIQ